MAYLTIGMTLLLLAGRIWGGPQRDSAAGIAAFLDAICLAAVFGGGLAFAMARGVLSQNRNQGFGLP
tara:strand:+ start:139 stop:339 length:201 start_codon:yes stop_codon:yes gene_type:complete